MPTGAEGTQQALAGTPLTSHFSELPHFYLSLSLSLMEAGLLIFFVPQQEI